MKTLKLLDKFLKILKTDRNTFFTYILTLISVYLLVDRIAELLMLFFTGIGISYWGPITYTLAIACPVFAFLFSGRSVFAKSEQAKWTLLYTYVISLYVIGISMATQWVNQLMWLFLLSVPNYVDIVTNFGYLIKPAFTSIAVYIPLTTFFGVFKFIYTTVRDNRDILDSIVDYKGISLAPPPSDIGPYSCEMPLCKDRITGKAVVVSENRRFEAMLVMGPSGSGKTALVFEPMIARDIEKKYFYKEVSKEMGYAALKTGIAVLKAPYNNDYINENFTLNMLSPVEGKQDVYKTYMKKLITDSNGNNIYYRNIGLTFMSPDYESTQNMINVAKNFHIPYNIIDPMNPDSIGINPFVFDDPSKTAVAISSVLKGMYNTTHVDVEEAFMENVAAQAIENLSILLKEMYPLLHEGALPTLEDMLKLLTDFDLVEDLCRKMEYDEGLSEKYALLLAYFKKHFYRDSVGRADTERYVFSAVTQLDNLLRTQNVKELLCNRYHNIDFDKALAEGQITFVCTRRGDLGATAHKAFGLFFILLMQYSVLKRPGTEKARTPHFLYIDEFPDFICRSTEALFTTYRKYHVGTIISAQALDQLGKQNSSVYRQTILSNCSTKITFGNMSVEDSEFWNKEFGQYRKWIYKNTYDTSKGAYDSKYSDIKWEWTDWFKPDKLRALPFKQCAYKTKSSEGIRLLGQGSFNFLESKYKENQKVKKYDFSRFTNGISEEEPTKKEKTPRFDYSNINFIDKNKPDEMDPIKTDTSDSFIINNEDAIVINFKKGEKN